ncbi:MarR family winged helix-turn-helix transcriptional regulator [Pseudorhodoferax sp. Leaf267]|uniref:MarR family winged helix-turn-helix transcriptional regulator n=1 Tax=Pseudorhodoferax sp. Leaf267 TaxID=1736316 RepID=UPI0006F870BD|nr:MarR family winged helix-turn-helix transcriptional regulator [Pseudorhodoferax sp. Leaf267]KQP18299.1 MarR family transcriptional regulator [Pseudorhodoferax sp. Leaf267]
MRRTPPDLLPDSSADYAVTDQVGHLLRRAYQRHVALFQSAIPDSQLTAAQFVTLCAVRDMGGCSLNDVVKRTAIDQATVRGVVERLVARGLLTVSAHQRDGRKRELALTDAGRQLVAATVPFAQQVTDRTFGDFNPAERLALVYLLRRMAEMP